MAYEAISFVYDHQNKIDGCIPFYVIEIVQHQFTTLFHIKDVFLKIHDHTK